MGGPLVSILINNYNYGRFLSDAIDSSLNQDYPDIEVIVVDDGSTDSSREIIEGYGNRIIAVLKENGGQASAFNSGFEASRGSIVCFLDSDDWFAPEKVSLIVEAFNRNSSSGWLVHNLRHVGNDQQSTSISEFADFTPPPVSSGDYTELVRSGKYKTLPWLPATSGICFRRQALEKILPVPLALRITADNYLKCAGLMTSPLIAIDDFLTCQRIHGSNAYSNADRQDKKFRKLSRQITRQILIGLYHLDKKQKYSRRLVLQNLKRSLKELDIADVTTSLKDLLYYS